MTLRMFLHCVSSATGSVENRGRSIPLKMLTVSESLFNVITNGTVKTEKILTIYVRATPKHMRVRR